MTDIWDEKPISFIGDGLVGPLVYRKDEIDDWIESLKSYYKHLDWAAQTLEGILDPIVLPRDYAKGLEKKADKWDRFIGNPLIRLEFTKQTDFLIECYDKLEAVKDIISTDLSNHNKLSAIEDILGGE